MSTKPSDLHGIIDHFCDLCIEDNEHSEANSFCTECKQYLCKSCHKCHHRGSVTKHHKLLTGKDLPSRSKSPHISDKPVGNETKAWIERKPIYIKQIDLAFASDDKTPEITSLEVMNDGSLIMADPLNKKLKLFDAEYEQIHELSLPSQPYGICLLGPVDILVTVAKELYLQTVMRTKSDLVLGEQIPIKFRCDRLLPYKDRFVVCGYDDLYRFVSIMDKNGKIGRSIYSEPLEAKEVLKNLNDMAVNPENDMVYTVNEIGCVGISFTRGIVFRYKELEKTTYYGVCSDQEGFVYVACCQTNKIIMLNNEGEKVKDLLCLEGMSPAYMQYCRSEHKFFVERDQRKKMLCYEMKN